MPHKGTSVLIVEDDQAINEVATIRLRRDGLDVTPAFSGTEAAMLLQTRRFDVVICDLMLPGLSGEELVSRMRQDDPDLPILIISAKGTAADKVNLLGLGADDYLSKPFDLDELAARVQVQLRHGRNRSAPYEAGDRSCKAQPQDMPGAGSRIRRGRWEIDPAGRTLTVDGNEVPLTRTEFNIAKLLAAHPNRVFTKQELFESAWGEPYMAQESTVSAHVSNLRAKLKPTGTDDYIQTVWGIGFKLAADA